MRKRILALMLSFMICFTTTTVYATEDVNIMPDEAVTDGIEIPEELSEEHQSEIPEQEIPEPEISNLEEQEEVKPELLYSAHIQNIGWQEEKVAGTLAGTKGQALRMEAIKIGFSDDTLNSQIEYRAHVQNIGWQDWVSGGEVAGTSGKKLRVEAVQIRLKGDLAEKYNICYSTHISDFGDLAWTSNGGCAGSQGFAEAIEAIKISIFAKEDVNAPAETGRSFVKVYEKKDLQYSGHIRNLGDVKSVSSGEILGTNGKGLPIEGITISLNSTAIDAVKGSLIYRLHIQNVGWQNWKENGEFSGTIGKALQVEAMQIKLTGEAEKRYNIYYRVHIQDFGWLGWAVNGEKAGSEGLAKRMEAVQITVVPKKINQEEYTDSENSFKDTWMDPNKPMIALTFDDGPGVGTERILDVLEKYNARATFFMLGDNAKRYPFTVKRIVQSRSEIGNHSLNHPQLTKLSATGIRQQMNTTSNIIAQASGGARPTVMRPPGGAVNSTVQNNVGLPIILWSVDTLDWKTRDTQKTINVVLSQARDGDIVLMHDIHKPTVEAAVRLIPELTKRGYQLVTVSELAKAKGIKLVNGGKYSQF